MVSLPRDISSCRNQIVDCGKSVILVFFNKIFNNSQNLYVHDTKMVEWTNIAEIDQTEVISFFFLQQLVGSWILTEPHYYFYMNQKV